MDFLAGTLFGVGVTGFFGCLLIPGAIHKMAQEIKSMKIVVERLADKKSVSDGDWWKDGVSYDEGDD